MATEITGGCLLGRGAYEVTGLPGGPVATATSPGRGVLIYGDLSVGYLMAGAGTVIEMKATVHGPSGRPTLQRGLIMWSRVADDAVTAFAHLTATPVNELHVTDVRALVNGPTPT